MENDLKARTKKFAVEVIRYCGTLPQTEEMRVVRRQLIKCASSVGANYRSACRGKSKADFIAKLSIVEEEADEAVYWFELIESLQENKEEIRDRLKDEGSQIVAIMVSSKRTARNNR